ATQVDDDLGRGRVDPRHQLHERTPPLVSEDEVAVGVPGMAGHHVASTYLDIKIHSATTISMSRHFPYGPLRRESSVVTWLTPLCTNSPISRSCCGWASSASSTLNKIFPKPP